MYCSDLTSITIPSSVTHIDEEAFYGCTGLTRIEAYPNPEDISLGLAVFSDVPKDGTLHVLQKYLDTYQNADQWRDFTNIVGDLTDTLSGDVNSDNALDITDVVGIANHVMGDTPGIFAKASADINGDGGVDVTDVVKLANIVMGM